MKATPNLAIDYLVLNAGILKYPNVRGLEYHNSFLLLTREIESNRDLYVFMPQLCSFPNIPSVP